MQTGYPTKQHQRGAVLAVSLVILLLMTLIGLSAMQSTSLEERMAGNTRDRNLAFQAAESGIRDAETFINGLVANPVRLENEFLAEGPLLDLDTLEHDYQADATWQAASSMAYGEAAGAAPLQGVNSQPRYFIKHLGRVRSTKEMSQNSDPIPLTSIFRITSRGTGGTDNARVTLRSHYAIQRLETE